MKNKEEPSANSLRGNPSSTEETTGSLSRPGSTAAARVEQPALSLLPETLMEAMVDSANMEAAWKNVKGNCGAPGPDGITIAEFSDWLRPRWPEIRQQLLDGTYRPGPVRRKTIDKPGGGQRLLGIPNVIDRLIPPSADQHAAVVWGARPATDAPTRLCGIDCEMLRETHCELMGDDCFGATFYDIQGRRVPFSLAEVANLAKRLFRHIDICAIAQN